MTKPIRWSDPASDADPVLRAVVRYAQHIEPSARDVGSLATIVAREESRLEPHAATPARASRVGLSRPMLRGSLAFAVVAGAGIAFGMTFTRAPEPSRRVPAVSSDRAPDVESKRPLGVPVGLERPQPVASASEPTPNRARSVAPATPTAPAAGSASSPAPPAPSATVIEAAGDLALLAAARRELKTQPTKTLALLAEHERLFPGSSFGEERAALQIEALFGLARRAEAERAYAAFNAKFPGSIYGLRLAAARQR